MNLKPDRSRLLLPPLLLGVLLWFVSGISALAQSAGGTIEGRVVNTRSGEFVERARITVEGSAAETFSDSGGNYRLTNLPAGTAKVRVFFTGLLPRTDDVSVVAGQIARHDVNLQTFETRADSAAGGVVKLD